MFNLCGSCKTSQNRASEGYLVKKHNEQPKFYADYQSINQVALNSPNISMVKLARSTYDVDDIKSKAKSKAFTDQQFGPEETSLGKFDNMLDKWKRVTELGEGLSLFGHEIQPQQATFNNYPNSIGIQAALACLAQVPARVMSIIGDQQSSIKNGVCSILLRHKGQIKEIVVDNYVPVDNVSTPLFSQPFDNSYWVLMMEKARAKAYGSYKNMAEQGDDVRRVLQEFTFAPTDVFKTDNMGKEELWEIITQATTSSGVIKPMIGYTSNNQNIKWSSVHLTPNHFYTIVGSATLAHKLGSSFKILKLRNAFKVEEYEGDGSKSDQLFWDQVQSNQQKSRILSSVGSKEGIIYMLYTDYLKYFESTLVSQVEESTKYNSLPLIFDEKQSGVVFRVNVEKEGNYCLSVDQNDMSIKEGEDFRDGWSRCTILLIKDNSSKLVTEYQYVGGILKYNEQHPTLRARIGPGRYIIYIKLDPTLNHRAFPKQVNLVVYSSHAAYLKQASQKQMPDLIRKVFLAHGKANKRQFYNNDLMWSSWKLVAQGGYAYLVFGNLHDSKFKFVIKLDKQILLKQNYAVKYPEDSTSILTMEVKPGQQQIILLRVCNSDVKEINFPPPIDLQIVPIL